MNESTTLLTIKEMAARLGIGRDRAYELAARPDFPTIKLSLRTIRVPVDALDRWIEQEATKSTEGVV